MKLLIVVLSLGAAIALAADRRGPASFVDKKFTVNFKNTPIKEALELIVRQAGLTLETEADLTGNVSYAFSNVTLEEALNTLAKDNKISFHLRGNVISVSQSGSVIDSAGPVGDFRFREVSVRYVKASELLSTVAPLVKKDESVVANQYANSLIFFGSVKTHEKIKELVGLYDQKPSQVLIEAQIIETTANFARDIGISLGDLQPATAGFTPQLTGSVTTPGPTSANFTGAYKLGVSPDGRVLEAKITAAESAGDAKVVSRPKIYTLNNQRAIIHSGITYNVKTLSAVSNGSGSSTSTGSTTGGTSGTVTGGLQQISAGLQLEVTPTIMGQEAIRLAIKVVKSEADEGSAVDGIPGIIDNSAESSLVVKNGTTAMLGGLIKNTNSKTNNRVPFLGTLPLIGWLFSSHSDRDRATELVILITPTIAGIQEKNASVGGAAGKAYDEMQRQPAADAASAGKSAASQSETLEAKPAN